PLSDDEVPEQHAPLVRLERHRVNHEEVIAEDAFLLATDHSASSTFSRHCARVTVRDTGARVAREARAGEGMIGPTHNHRGLPASSLPEPSLRGSQHTRGLPLLSLCERLSYPPRLGSSPRPINLLTFILRPCSLNVHRSTRIRSKNLWRTNAKAEYGQGA